MNIRIPHHNHRVRGDYRNINILGVITKLSHICFSCLAQISPSSSYSPMKIILKQLFAEDSVTNIAEYLPRRSRSEHSAIFFSPSANILKYSFGNSNNNV